MPGLYSGKNSHPDFTLVFFTLLGTFLMSSASFILNQYIERDRDALMERTKDRPLPKGEIKPLTALISGIAIAVFAFYLLFEFANLLTAICASGALLFYIFIYTILLKPRTDQNIVVGGIAGCAGPLIGYAASENNLPVESWILFLMIFLWTPAHFWALAIFLKEDYKSADLPMLPVVQGISKTKKAILIYTILYSISCVGFYFSDIKSGIVYIVPTVLLCGIMIFFAIRLFSYDSEIGAKKFFFFSIIHLFLINILIIGSHSI